MDLRAARDKLLGFGVQVLDGIDPNPDNIVCAGIVHTQGQQVGCLLRLEPNKVAQVLKLLVPLLKLIINNFGFYLNFRCSVLRFVQVKRRLQMKYANYW